MIWTRVDFEFQKKKIEKILPVYCCDSGDKKKEKSGAKEKEKQAEVESDPKPDAKPKPIEQIPGPAEPTECRVVETDWDTKYYNAENLRTMLTGCKGIVTLVNVQFCCLNAIIFVKVFGITVRNCTVRSIPILSMEGSEVR